MGDQECLLHGHTSETDLELADVPRHVPNESRRLYKALAGSLALFAVAGTVGYMQNPGQTSSSSRLRGGSPVELWSLGGLTDGVSSAVHSAQDAAKGYLGGAAGQRSLVDGARDKDKEGEEVRH